MGIFFTSWESWQGMTFHVSLIDPVQVLGCAIVFVFAMGVLKLWWVNRKLRKHEVIEDERHARLAQMRYCGIESLGANEIPFGIRALENGVKVEGVWASQSDTPDDNQLASAAEPPRDAARTCKGKESAMDASSTRRASWTSVTDNAIDTSPSCTTVNNGGRRGDWSASDVHDAAESVPLPSRTLHQSPAPSESQCQGRRLSDPPLRTHHPGAPRDSSSSHAQRQAPRTQAWTPRPSSLDAVDRARAYGAAKVYANRSSRASNSGFHILPAGILGPRAEFTDHDQRNYLVDYEALSRSQATPAKLRKAPPR